jgi:hypothetical protein
MDQVETCAQGIEALEDAGPGGVVLQFRPRRA